MQNDAEKRAKRNFQRRMITILIVGHIGAVLTVWGLKFWLLAGTLPYGLIILALCAGYWLGKADDEGL